MTRVESIIEEAMALSPEERARLVDLLLQQFPVEEEHEIAAAQRGLAAWTESTKSEDWSTFYPTELDHHQRPSL